jgi:hypothetical protein
VDCRLHIARGRHGVGSARETAEIHRSVGQHIARVGERQLDPRGNLPSPLTINISQGCTPDRSKATNA